MSFYKYHTKKNTHITLSSIFCPCRVHAQCQCLSISSCMSNHNSLALYILTHIVCNTHAAIRIYIINFIENPKQCIMFGFVVAAVECVLLSEYITTIICADSGAKPSYATHAHTRIHSNQLRACCAHSAIMLSSPPPPNTSRSQHASEMPFM